MHAASAGIGVAIANRLPNIQLTGDAGSTALSFSHVPGTGLGFWDLGAGHHWCRSSRAAPCCTRKGRPKPPTSRPASSTARRCSRPSRTAADTLAALQHDAEGLQAAAAAADAAKVSLDLSERQWAPRLRQLPDPAQRPTDLPAGPHRPDPGPGQPLLPTPRPCSRPWGGDGGTARISPGQECTLSEYAAWRPGPGRPCGRRRPRGLFACCRRRRRSRRKRHPDPSPARAHQPLRGRVVDGRPDGRDSRGLPTSDNDQATSSSRLSPGRCRSCWSRPATMEEGPAAGDRRLARLRRRRRPSQGSCRREDRPPGRRGRQGPDGPQRHPSARLQVAPTPRSAMADSAAALQPWSRSTSIRRTIQAIQQGRPTPRVDWAPIRAPIAGTVAEN